MENAVKKKILLIDDDTSLLVTLSDFLSFEGYDITTADSGELGLKRLKRMTPDLIILDMSMPGMGGVGFLKEISDDSGKPRWPVLVLTARANMAEFFANVDVDGFVAKPCDPEDLLMEVGRIIFLTSGSNESASGTRQPERRKVLLAEDEDDIRAALVAGLTGADFVVSTVVNGPEVLEKAIVERPDVIVLKRVLSNMNGDAVAGILQQMPNTRDVPVILYDEDSSDLPDINFAGAGSGIDRFVRGNSADKILTAVNKLLAS